MGTWKARGVAVALAGAVAVGGVAVPAPAATPTVAAVQASAAWETMTRVQSQASVWRTAARGGGVWMLGDSISVAAYRPLVRDYHARTGKQVAVDLNSGIPTGPAVDRLADRVAVYGPPRTLVMATGANDAVAVPGVMPGQALRVRQIVGPRTKVVWVNVSVGRTRGTTKAADLEASKVVNAHLTGCAREGVISRVVDWHGFLSRRPGLREYYLRDGVHPNAPLGVNAWAALVGRGL